jgi:glycosyltransferase involved in cell wall biosynthesis
MSMHVCIVVPHTRVSGGTKVLFRLAQLLTAANVAVTVLAFDFSDILWIGKCNFDVKKIDKISKYTVPSTCTHLITYGDCLLFGPLPDIPVILYLQGFGINYERECINLMYPYHAVIATSRWLADIAEDQFGHKNVQVIPPGIDPIFTPRKRMKNISDLKIDPYWRWDIKQAKKTSTDNLPTIGCLYHHAGLKNMEEFFSAMNQLHKQQKIRVLFLSAKEVHKDVFKDVKWPYYVYVNPPQERIPYLYYLSNIWVAPSKNEGFGLCPLEAMACGTPTIIKPSFGLDEYLVDNENCLLLNNDTERSNMALRTGVLLKDKELQTKLIKNGIDLAKQFTWEKFLTSFWYALENL